MRSFWLILVSGLVLPPLAVWAQASTPQLGDKVAVKNEEILQMHYQLAMKDQSAHQLVQASQQYRMFLADALGELAIAEAHGNEYGKAAPNFDGALNLAPNSPALLVEYAEAALHAGRLEKAAELARKVIQEYPKNKNAAERGYLVLGRAQLKAGQSADARKSFEKAVALNPDFQNGYSLAVACLAMEDQKCAADMFDRMKASYGDRAILHMLFGQAYMESDFQDKAVDEFKEAIAKNPKLPGEHYSLAAAYLVTGQHVLEAEAQLRQEIALFPKEAMAHAGLGHLEAGQHKYQEALKELQTAAALDPKDPGTFLYLGQLYAAMHQSAKAEAALRKSIGLTTDITQNLSQLQKAHYLLGRLLLQGGDRAAAQKEMQTAQHMMNRNLSQAREQLAKYYHQGSDSISHDEAPSVKTSSMETEASEQAAQAAAGFAQRVGPYIANSYNNLGAIAGMQGDVASAYEYFSQAKQWDPTMPGLNENLGRAAFSSFHFAEAVPPLTAYVGLHPNDETMRAALGVSLYMTKAYAKAEAALQPVIENGKVTDEVAYIYAESLVKSGHPAEGVTRLKALAAKLPQEENVRRSLGEAYAANGEMQQAVTALQAAEKLNGKDPQAHEDLAVVYRKLGRQAEAVREVQLYQSLTGKSGGK